jgi:hypothetical protein
MSRLYWHDLPEAPSTLQMLTRYRRDDVRFSLLRDFIVSYARPFSVNRAPPVRKHHLSLRFAANAQRDLHRELIGLRSSVFAHTDFDYHRPRVARWETRRGPVYPMTIRTASYSSLISREPELRALTTDVQTALGVFQQQWEADY